MKRKDGFGAEKSFETEAVKVSNVSIIGNTVLSLAKLFAGIFAHSQAMISDAVHSASDVLSSFIVIIGVKLAAKESDENHPYGHERLESVAAIVLAIVLFVTGIFIGHTAIEKLSAGDFESIKQPGILAVIAAIVSIVAKEAMYHFTMHYAKAWDSGALKADAWHHRSDALSSIGSLIGIVGARLGYLFLEPIASLVICLFIVKAAYDIFKDAIDKMVDHSCSVEMKEDILNCAKEHPAIYDIVNIQTREFGNRIYVDLTACADGNLTLKEATAISKEVHDSIEKRFPKIKHISIILVAKE